MFLVWYLLLVFALVTGIGGYVYSLIGVKIPGIADKKPK